MQSSESTGLRTATGEAPITGAFPGEPVRRSSSLSSEHEEAFSMNAEDYEIKNTLGRSALGLLNWVLFMGLVYWRPLFIGFNVNRRLIGRIWVICNSVPGSLQATE